MIDLVALRAPAPEIRLPNDRVVQLHYLRGDGYAKLWEYKTHPENGELFLAVLKCALPDATDEDLDSLSIHDAAEIIGMARGKIDLVEQARKNGGSDVVDPAASPTPPSNPTT